MLQLLSESSWIEIQRLTPLIKEAVDLIDPEKTQPKTMCDSCMTARIADRKFVVNHRDYIMICH